ncbi:hypothetical protein EDI_144350 [Entamoeba dispar SAW760]|uniref:Uncharacterized protein n=1 Tax=Entamoeba dispar (strain ATCC PRA-260 / SAW760) TaxID=370354 RepID=B0EM11_ENTDS|nr:uncharacterized protein EDI_144350 [Entamoeba dispar SAW760]EDR24405.1 hypothetical protein EDI_144350 [Entamoeba dispar SAW760]|eukprot:EDR24405.1 hypothetical protein EDI_144350 [Entamoeba dispar SAW760]
MNQYQTPLNSQQTEYQNNNITQPKRNTQYLNDYRFFSFEFTGTEQRPVMEYQTPKKIQPYVPVKINSFIPKTNTENKPTNIALPVQQVQQPQKQTMNDITFNDIFTDKNGVPTMPESDGCGLFQPETERNVEKEIKPSSQPNQKEQVIGSSNEISATDDFQIDSIPMNEGNEEEIATEYDDKYEEKLKEFQSQGINEPKEEIKSVKQEEVSKETVTPPTLPKPENMTPLQRKRWEEEERKRLFQINPYSQQGLSTIPLKGIIIKENCDIKVPIVHRQGTYQLVNQHLCKLGYEPQQASDLAMKEEIFISSCSNDYHSFLLNRHRRFKILGIEVPKSTTPNHQIASKVVKKN